MNLADFLNTWIVSWGPAKMFNFVAGVQIALCFLTIPVWVYSKKLRGWWHNVYNIGGHETQSQAQGVNSVL